MTDLKRWGEIVDETFKAQRDREEQRAEAMREAFPGYVNALKQLSNEKLLEMMNDHNYSSSVIVQVENIKKREALTAEILGRMK